LFIPQVIYEHGEPWWNDISRGKLLIHPPELQPDLVKELWHSKYLCSYFEMIFTCHKIDQHGANGFTSLLKEGVKWILIALKSPSP
jgi:hypothetical protein